MPLRKAGKQERCSSFPRFLSGARCGEFALAALVVLLGCAEEPTATLTPIDRSRPSPSAAPASPYLVSPSPRRSHASDPSPRSGGGGGGRRPLPPPSDREVDRFRTELERQAGERVDPSDDSCEQMIAIMQASNAAATPPGRRPPALPSENALEERCGELPESFTRCLGQDYFRQHADDCLREMQRMAEHGRRESEQARRDMAVFRRGGPLPRHEEPSE